MGSRIAERSDTSASAQLVEIEEELSSPGVSDWIIIPKDVSQLTIGLFITSGEGRIEYTLSPIAKVEADTARVRIWDAGSVTASADDVLARPTAIRLVNVSGTVVMEGSGV